MRAHGILIGGLLLGLGLSLVSARATPQEDYLAIYLARPDSPEALEEEGDLGDALRGFQDRCAKLEKIQQAYPEWEPALISKHLEECRAKIVDLQKKRRETTRYP